MPSHHVARDPFTESINDLVRRVAERDQIAFGRLYRRLVHHVYTQVREVLGDPASAVPVTRAVFVEVWRLAPMSTGRHDDALAWLNAIALRRVADRQHGGDHRYPYVATPYDEHVGQELEAILATARQDAA